MSRLPRYRLPPALRKHVLTTGLSAPPLTLCLDFQVNSTDGREPELEPEDVEDTESPCGNTPDDAESPATSTSKGSFNWDREKGEFNIEWANLAAFETWRREEEQMYSIEFAASTTQPRTSLYTRHQLFVCGREASRGEVSYEKKNPDSERKIGTKKTGCGCHIWIKLYPHTSTILGCYVAEHDHEIGFANITYTRLSGSARERIKAMLTQKVEHHEIVRVVCNLAPDGTCDQLIALEEVNHIARVLENDEIRLHPDDAVSTRLMIEQLSSKGTLTFYKDKQDHPPINSRLPDDAFVLCIQTSFQLDTFQHLGNGFIGIDATHNTTQYQDLLLFMIIARDHWGHGVPVAWMLTSSGTTDIIAFFVKWVRDASPSVWPRVIMTDHDQAQIAALKFAYPQSRIFLCTWHVLRVIQTHFVTTQFQALWDKIKAWVNTEDVAEFLKIWDKISSDPSVPQSVVKYLATEWLQVLHMWSKVARKNRSIYEEGNTNMLIELYHHLLKTHYLGGKRNRRVDCIVHTLVLKVVPDFNFKHRQQLAKIEGRNLGDSRRRQIEASARNMSPDSIHYVGGTTFYVASQSRLDRHYYVIDLTQSTCECNDFPRIRYCKHIAAINVHFPQFCPKGNSPSKILERMRIPNLPERIRVPNMPEHVRVSDMPEREHTTPRSEEESAEIILKDINALCQQLSAVSDCSTLDLKTLRAIKYSLKTAIALANGSRALPKKDFFNSNQKTWAEMAERMGIKKTPKRKSPVGRNTDTERIGPAKGKHSCKYIDPYAGGERSGKRAKPDAVSAAANTLARAAVPAPAVHTPTMLAPTHASPSAAHSHSFTFTKPSGAAPLAYPPSSGVPGLAFASHAAAVLAPARVSPSAAAAGSAAHSFALANPSGAVPHAYPPSSGAPSLVFAPFSAASLGHAFAPPSASGTGFGYARTSTQTAFRGEIIPGNALARVHLPPELDLSTNAKGPVP